MNGASILVIDQGCDNDQLLVSLSKNGAKWLSPVGWTDQQKVALLDCRSNGERTEIDIPAEFTRDINDHSGRFNEAFEKEALRAIERRRYKPKTMNGIAVESKGQKKRIVFRAE